MRADDKQKPGNSNKKQLTTVKATRYFTTFIFPFFFCRAHPVWWDLLCKGWNLQGISDSLLHVADSLLVVTPLSGPSIFMELVAILHEKSIYQRRLQQHVSSISAPQSSWKYLESGVLRSSTWLKGDVFQLASVTWRNGKRGSACVTLFCTCGQMCTCDMGPALNKIHLQVIQRYLSTVRHIFI